MLEKSRGVRSKLSFAIYAADITETIAIEEGVLLPREMNLTLLIIKSDSLVVVLALRSGSLGGDMDPIIQDSLTMLESFCS